MQECSELRIFDCANFALLRANLRFFVQTRTLAMIIRRSFRFAIDFLNRLLQENDSNDVTKLQLTDVIFLYDSLNEDALTMKCYILYNSGKKGLAKNTYDNFCKEYFSLLGEKYKYSLAQILEFAEHQDKVKHA